MQLKPWIIYLAAFHQSVIIKRNTRGKYSSPSLLLHSHAHLPAPSPPNFVWTTALSEFSISHCCYSRSMEIRDTWKFNYKKSITLNGSVVGDTISGRVVACSCCWILSIYDVWLITISLFALTLVKVSVFLLL